MQINIKSLIDALKSRIKFTNLSLMFLKFLILRLRLRSTAEGWSFLGPNIRLRLKVKIGPMVQHCRNSWSLHFMITYFLVQKIMKCGDLCSVPIIIFWAKGFVSTSLKFSIMHTLNILYGILGGIVTFALTGAIYSIVNITGTGIEMTNKPTNNNLTNINFTINSGTRAQYLSMRV